VVITIIIIIIIVIDVAVPGDSYTWNITHNTETTEVCKLKRHRWFTRSITKKEPVTRDNNNHNI
jgi:hypothetical protein